MRGSIAKAEKTSHARLKGISVLGQTYVAIDEPALGYRTVIRGLQELGRAGIADAEFRARLLKPSNVDDRPELIWRTFRQQLPEYSVPWGEILILAASDISVSHQ